MNQSFLNSNPQKGFSVAGMIKSYGFQFVALGLLVMAMVVSGRAGAIQAFRGVLRFVWPILLIWFVLYWLKKKFSKKLSDFQSQIMKAAQDRVQNNSGAPVIDLCPKCGNVKNANHKCK